MKKDGTGANRKILGSASSHNHSGERSIQGNFEGLNNFVTRWREPPAEDHSESEMPFSVMKQWVEEAPTNMIFIDEQDASMRGGANLQTQRESAVFGAQKNPSCSSSLLMQGGITSEKKITGCPKINCETSRKTS